MSMMTLTEIAQAANVSPTTVSFVLHNRPGVGPETRKRVQALLFENGYIDNKNRKLQAKKRTFLFIKYIKNGDLVEGNDGFVLQIIDAAEKKARSLGIGLLMTSCRGNKLAETFSIIRSEPVDGIILVGTELEPQYFPLLKEIDIPIIVIDNYVPYCDVNSVVMNNIETVFLSVKHLYELGHRKIGYLHSNFSIINFEERFRGYKLALEQLGLPYNPSLVFNVGVTLESAYGNMEKYLAENPILPTAFFCDNDIIAIGSMRALQGKGYVIPKDISIIGFDDISFCTMANPPLTTMRIPRQIIGERAVEILVSHMENQSISTEKVQISGELILRQSTATPCVTQALSAGCLAE